MNVEDARKKLAVANDTMEKERTRLAAARRDLAEADSRIRAVDPDDDKALARAVQARDAARGRVEAFEARVASATAAVADARARFDEAEQKERETALAALLAKISDKSDEVNAATVNARRRVAEKFQEIRDLVQSAKELHDSMGREHRETVGFPPFTDPWCNAAHYPGTDPLVAAIRLAK